MVADICNLAAPLVAGVIAQLMPKLRRLTLTVYKMYTCLSTKAGWVRPTGGDYVIWNQVNDGHNSPVNATANSSLLSLMGRLVNDTLVT